MGLLAKRSSMKSNMGYPKVCPMNTFFYRQLTTGGYSAVQRWTNKVDIFSYDLLLVPIHVDKVHWCMAIIDFRQKTMKHYDSMRNPKSKMLDPLIKYLRDESLDKKNTKFNTEGWSHGYISKHPQQTNGSDCGVFSCMTAEFISRNRPITFTQQHMTYFRQRMVLEICQGKLLNQ